MYSFSFILIGGAEDGEQQAGVGEGESDYLGMLFPKQLLSSKITIKVYSFQARAFKSQYMSLDMINECRQDKGDCLD